MEELLAALEVLAMPTILLWPNIDAGADHITKAIRVFRDQVRPEWLRALTNLTPESYLKVLANAACAIGNSSSFVRDGSFLGTPVVLIGNRQHGREVGAHVRPAAPVAAEVVAAVRAQLEHGRYPASALYGDGFVSERIAEALARLAPYVQKRLHYIDESEPSGKGNDASSGYRDGARRLTGGPPKEHRAPVGQATPGLHG
jgi:hypothetical protein